MRQGLNVCAMQILQLWKLNHENVVKMVGFRLEAKEKVVVFEYAPLGSLRDILLHGKFCGLTHVVPLCIRVTL